MSTLDEPPVPPPKTEEPEEDSFSDSSHDFDGPEEYVQEAAQVQKRKGGRKPVGTLAYFLEEDAHLGPDICNIRGEEATKSPGSSSISRAED